MKRSGEERLGVWRFALFLISSSFTYGEVKRKGREERREGERPTLSTDRLFFNPLAKTRHVTCRCGVAADQRRPSRLG